jgi:thioesterase domain-containing protein
LLGYSFGTLLALELALELEAEGREGQLYLVDGSPDYTKSMFQNIIGTHKEQFDNKFMCAIYDIVAPQEATSEVVRKVFHVKNIKP